MVIPLVMRHSPPLSPTTVKRLVCGVSALKSLYSRHRFHVCLGGAKTGTTPISHMFEPDFTAAHQPETLATVRQAIAYLKGRSDLAMECSALLARARRLYLELESSHPLGDLSYRRVFSALPCDRRRGPRTCNLSHSSRSISEFVGASVDRLQLSFSKRFPNKITLLEQMPEAFVRTKIWQHCQSIVRQYLPETVEPYAF
ncbi:MAG: hypothetical protein AB4050_10955 [Synechococcus sp.]